MNSSDSPICGSRGSYHVSSQTHLGGESTSLVSASPLTGSKGTLRLLLPLSDGRWPPASGGKAADNSGRWLLYRTLRKEILSIEPFDG